MRIVYNPPTGAPIKGFNFNGSIVESHNVKEMKQYEDEMAEALIANYPFMSIVTSDEAKEIQDQTVVVSPGETGSDGQFKCEVCGFGAKAKIGLSGHMRKHIKEGIVPDIPVAEVASVEVDERDMGTQIPDDLVGTDFYGPGPEESRND